LNFADRDVANGHRARVLICDGHKLFAEALSAILSDHGLEVLAIATNGADALEVAIKERPHLVLIDLGLDGDGSVATGKRVLENSPSSKVLALSGQKDSITELEAIEAGFCGCLTKDTPLDEFMSSVEAALEGELVTSRYTRAEPAAAAEPGDKHATLLMEQLTGREREVLALLVTGSSGDDLARQLSVSANTVRTHVQSILMKLQVHSRLEAAAFAARFEPGVGANGRLRRRPPRPRFGEQ